MEYPNGNKCIMLVDTSRHQGKIDGLKLSTRTPPIRGIISRATISYGYRDPMYNDHQNEARRYNMARGAYHVVYPNSSTSPVKDQMKNFIDMCGVDFGNIPPILDVELSHDALPSLVTSTVLECAEILDDYLKDKPNSYLVDKGITGRCMIYSRASFIDKYMKYDLRLRNYSYMIAHYGKDNGQYWGPPAIPVGVPSDNILIHQFTSRGNPTGVESKSLDLNVWTGPVDDYYKFISGKQPEPVLSTEEQILSLVKDIHGVLIKED